MIIGTLGDIAFEVSFTDDEITVFTFDNLKRSNKNRIAKHDVIGSKPLTELIGPDLGEIKFNMLLSASLGVSPLKSMDQIYTAFSAETPMTFMLGGYTIGNYQWTISEFEEEFSRVDNRGCVWQINLDVTLQEYIATVGDKTSTTSTTTTTSSTTSQTTTNSNGITGGGDGGENPVLSGGG